MEDFVTVATYFSLAEAEPARLALEAAGIPTLATDESVGMLLMPTMVSGIKLQVSAADADRAREVLAALDAKSQAETAEAERTDEEVSVKCPACEAEVWFPSQREGHVEVCPECGAYLDVPKGDKEDADTAEDDADAPEDGSPEP